MKHGINKLYDKLYDIHTGSSFNTGTENTIQVSKFKRIGFEKMADFDGANRFVNVVYLLSRSVSHYPNKNYVTDR